MQEDKTAVGVEKEKFFPTRGRIHALLPDHLQRDLPVRVPGCGDQTARHGGPMQVVKRDQQYRREAEEKNATSAFKASLSKVMSDKGLEENAYNGLAHVQGHSERKRCAKNEISSSSATRHDRDFKETSKRPRDGEQGGGSSKRRELECAPDAAMAVEIQSIAGTCGSELWSFLVEKRRRRGSMSGRQHSRQSV
jgi:hypothetical protein